MFRGLNVMRDVNSTSKQWDDRIDIRAHQCQYPSDISKHHVAAIGTKCLANVIGSGVGREEDG